MIGIRLTPAAPAYAALGCCAIIAGLSAQAALPASAMVWVLLGVTAGYSISGSP